MARKADLMGLGLPPLLARRMATEPTLVIGGGTSVGSAVQIGQDQYLVCVTASTGSNSAVVMPQIGGDGPNAGALLGDDFIINNQCSGSTIVYIANNASGSVVSISSASALTAGTTGVSVGTHRTMTMYSITSSTWLALTN